MATTNDLPEGFSNPMQGADDEEQDAEMSPGEEILGTYLGVESQGEGQYSPCYIVKIKTDEGLIRRFAQGDFKAAITNDSVEVGDTVYYQKAEESIETDEYGEVYPITFGTE